jgi:hypothetical protein
MSLQQASRSIERVRHQSIYTMNAPQGNPFAAAGAFHMPFPPEFHQQQFTGQQFGPPPTTSNSLVAQRDVGFPNFNGFGRFDPRRSAGRYGRGSRGLNNIVDINELVAGRDVRTTVGPSILSCINISSDLLIDHAPEHPE